MRRRGRGSALDWLFAYGKCSKAAVVPRGQLGLDESRTEPLWVMLAPLGAPSLPLPWGLRAWEEEGNLCYPQSSGPREKTSTPPLAQALSASFLFLSVADPRACWCCSADLDFPVLLRAPPAWCSSGIIFPLVRASQTQVSQH